MSEISVLVKKLKSESPTLSRADIALLVSNGQIIYSELSEKFEDLAKGEVMRSFNYWGIGDYFVKHFETANLIVGKVSDNLAFAICSREKTGLLILAFTNIVKNYKEYFKNIESTLKIAEVEEEKVKPEEKVVVEKPTKPVEPSVEMETPEISLSSWTVVEPVPSVQTSTVTMDQDMITLLRFVDGWKTIEELSKETGIPLEETIRKLSYLVSKGVLKSKYDDPVYKKKPVLIAKRKIEFAFMSFGTKLGKARSLNDIFKHINEEKTILDIARKLDARPEVLKTLFQNLERRKIIELK